MAIQQTYYLCRNHPNYPKGITERNKKINGRKKSNWITCTEEGGNFHLNLYVVKTKSTEIRNVLLLHTTEATHYVTNDEKKKPYTNKIYDSAKGGIDIPNQQMVSLTCKEKTRKWTLVALVYAAVNRYESAVKQYMQWIQRIQVQKALNSVGNWWYLLANLTWTTELRLRVPPVIHKGIPWSS